MPGPGTRPTRRGGGAGSTARWWLLYCPDMSPPTEHSASLVLTGRFENIELAERALLDLCAEAGADGDERYRIVTALREALANAIRHGCAQRPGLTVRVDVRLGPDGARIRVVDRGPGFDPTAVPDPTAPEHLLRPSGRGIFYMRQFMDRVEFQPAPGGGTEVLMTRQLQPTVRSANDEE